MDKWDHRKRLPEEVMWNGTLWRLCWLRMGKTAHYCPVPTCKRELRAGFQAYRPIRGSVVSGMVKRARDRLCTQCAIAHGALSGTGDGAKHA